MATKIVTKNSSTASAAPTASDLVQGELAVNVTDKRLYTENASGAIVELGTNPLGAVTMASTLTVAGVLTGASLDISGDIDVDGTTNLDVVDIDGAVDMASTLAVAGVVTANAGVVVDNFTLDGTTLALSSGDLTLDAAGDIILDADGADVIFKDGGTTFLEIDKDGNNARIKNPISDGDVLIQGSDAGSIVTALSLDMSAAGAATFNSSVSTPTLSSPDGTSILTLANSGEAQFGRGIVVNEAGLDSDFRVESVGNTHMLFVDGGNNRVGIGVSPRGGLALDVAGDIGQTWIDAECFVGQQYSTGGYRMGLITDSSDRTAQLVANAGDSTGKLEFYTNNNRAGLVSAVNDWTFFEGVTVNENGNDNDFRVESINDSSALFVDGADGTTTVRKLNLGVGGGLMGEGAISVGTSATNITSANDMGTLVIVAGNSSGAIFSDLVFFATTMGATVVTGGTVSGGPASRTYSVVSSKLKLAMASGTYSVKATAFHGTL